MRLKQSYKKEVKRQLRLAITAGLGFTVAFAWREAIFQTAQNAVQTLSNSLGLFQTQILAASSITLLAVLAIFITSKLLKE